MRHLTSVLPIVLCLVLTRPASAQSAKAHYEAGERAIKGARCVDAGREFEQAAKLASANQSYQARYSEFRPEASRCAQSAGQLLFAAGRMGEARMFLEEALRFDPQNAGAAELLDLVRAAISPAQAITPAASPAASPATIPAQQQTVVPPGAATSPNAKTGGDPTPIPRGVKLCLQPMTGGFDDFLIGEMQKQRTRDYHRDGSNG
jgi:tetratricopeptide (TPR) repeat protein